MPERPSTRVPVRHESRSRTATQTFQPLPVAGALGRQVVTPWSLPHRSGGQAGVSRIGKLALDRFSIPPADRRRFRMSSSAAEQIQHAEETRMGQEGPTTVALVSWAAAQGCLVLP